MQPLILNVVEMNIDLKPRFAHGPRNSFVKSSRRNNFTKYLLVLSFSILMAFKEMIITVRTQDPTLTHAIDLCYFDSYHINSR